eukprot:13477486-Alexandrium_andersonii.AAC.1
MLNLLGSARPSSEYETALGSVNSRRDEPQPRACVGARNRPEEDRAEPLPYERLVPDGGNEGRQRGS